MMGPTVMMLYFKWSVRAAALTAILSLLSGCGVDVGPPAGWERYDTQGRQVGREEAIELLSGNSITTEESPYDVFSYFSADGSYYEVFDRRVIEYGTRRVTADNVLCLNKRTRFLQQASDPVTGRNRTYAGPVYRENKICAPVKLQNDGMVRMINDGQSEDTWGSLRIWGPPIAGFTGQADYQYVQSLLNSLPPLPQR